MSKYVIALFFLFPVVQVNAEPLAVYQLESDQAYIQAPLEREIYFYSQDTNLMDVSVQDVKGNNLPFRIITTPTKSQGILRETPIPFFAIAPNTSTELLRTLSSTRIDI